MLDHASAPVPCLHSGALHLWLLRSERVDEALLQHYRHLLSDAEAIHLQRLRLPQVRRQYLLARALVRCTLSRYRQRPPAAWRFSQSAHGKPHIADARAAAGLEFNVSHTSGLLVCAVAIGQAVGVDVEYTKRQNRLSDVAARFFSPAECRSLGRLPPERRHDRFFTYWTLKESYIKARGLGLAIPLSQFSFELDATCGAISLSLADSLADDATRWRFWLWQAGPHHRLAACLEARADQPGDVHIWETVPLAGAASTRVVRPTLVASS